MYSTYITTCGIIDLHIDYYINGNEYRETVGETEGHGRWFSWKLGDESLC